MKLEFQRKVDRVAGPFLCWILSLFSAGKRDTSAGIRPRKFLVILLSEMGSLVLARPMFEHIRMKYPGASVHVLLFEQNREILETIDVVPAGNILTVRSTTLTGMLLDSLRALRELRRVKIDTVIDCDLFSRISSLYSFLSGARIRVGFHPHTQEGLFRGEFINRRVLYNPYHHISRQFITMVEAIDSEKIPKVKRPVGVDDPEVPPMNVNQDEIDGVLARFQKDFHQRDGKRLVLLYVGGGLLPVRAWPLEYFCIVAKDLVQRGYAVGIIGLKEDKALARKILADCRHDDCLDLTGYTRSIRELMILFHSSSLLITNDGGPGHFAAMTPLPAIVLYGPETPVLYHPLGSNSFSFHVPLSCSPCLTAYNHRNSPCDGDNVCLKSISPQAVLEKAREMLETERV